jgi:hypothetical protein
MIVVNGIKAMVDRFYNESPTYGHPVEFSVGKNQTEPEFEDTELDDEIEFEAGITEKEFVSGYPIVTLSDYSAKFRMFLNSLEANDEDINGVAIKDSSGNVYSINKFEPQTKTSAVEISIIKSEIWRE